MRPEVSRWDELYNRMRQIEAERLEAERRQREAEAARRERDIWAEAALDAMWRIFMLEVDARSAAFTRATGRPVEVVRHVRTQEAAGGLAALRILELRLGASVVYLYSHHGLGGEVHVHVALWPAPEGARRRHHRMISLPVCTLERVGERDWALCRISPGAKGRTLAVEDIVYRAFELLVFGIERPEPRLLGLPAAAELDPRSQKTMRQFPD